MSLTTPEIHDTTDHHTQEHSHTMATHTKTRRRWAVLAPRDGEPRWARPAVALMMIGTTILYLWNLTISQYGNSFYAAAVRAGSKSWTAMLFGSLDANNGITVDKPPAAYWIPSLFARIFGFNSFTVLFPQAVMGIAAVWVLYLAVRRTNGTVAGLIAGTTMAVTPVAVMMFRFNNPDAMLTLCLVLGAYFTIRALQSGASGRSRSGWWMFAAGLVIGLAFLVKMLQGFMTIPALVLAFAFAAQSGWLRRIRDVVLAGIGVCIPVGLYAAVFALWPEGSRPYMAGTNGNSFWELVMGYNGLARILGQSGSGAPGGETGAAEAGGTGAADAAGGAMGGGGAGGGASFGGSTGILRMFNSGFGPEISWLIPAAVIMLVAGLWFTRHAVRTHGTRAALMLWGGWLVVNAGIFSFMEGTIHPYYVVVLSPAIGALIGIGSVELWRGRRHTSVRWVLGISLLATVIWGFAIMQGHAPDWMPWIRWTFLIGGSLTAVAIVARIDEIDGVRGLRKGGVILALAALIFGGLGSASWGIATAGNAHSGSIPTAGPAAAASEGGMGGAPGGTGGQAGAAGQPGATGQAGAAGQTGANGQSGTGQSGSTGQSGTAGQQPSGSQSGQNAGGAQSDQAAQGSAQGSSSSSDGQDAQQEKGAQGGQGAMGGGQSNAELTKLLKNAGTKYSAATVGANGAAEYMLASDTEVLDIGGWMGSDPYPSLQQFQKMVSEGEIRYFVSGGMGGGGAPGGSSSSSEIQKWVAAHYKAKTVGGATVYDLSS